MAALVVIVAALDSTGGRLTLIEGHSGLTGGCTNNASSVETKAEQWKKWGRSLKTRGVGGVEAYAPAISVHHLHSPPEPQQWGSCSLGAEELHQGVQVSPPGRSTLGSGHCWRTEGLGTPCNLVTLWVRALHRAQCISCILPPLL